VSLQQVAFRGFANPVDPTSAELRAWAYHPDAVKMQNMPPDWDLLVAGDPLVNTLLELALDEECPARRFAMHCLYIYAADAIRTKFRAHPKRRLRKLVERAEDEGDEQLQLWAHNTRMLLAVPELFDYRDWCEGGLVRHPRRLRLPTAIAAGPASAAPGGPSIPSQLTTAAFRAPSFSGPSFPAKPGPAFSGPPPTALPGPRPSRD
jgi:hypothetical protein